MGLAMITTARDTVVDHFLFICIAADGWMDGWMSVVILNAQDQRCDKSLQKRPVKVVAAHPQRESAPSSCGNSGFTLLEIMVFTGL